MNGNARSIAARVRALAEFAIENDLKSVRVDRNGDVFEVVRRVQTPVALPAVASDRVSRIEQIASDRVGIFHVARPAPLAGETIESDRELGYVEQLGIRNPIRSRGAGRIVAVLQHDGDLVDYGRPLFELERS
ncbi:MAG: biotin/lipoyl-containing protein [Candidatus Tyrphobacter sp.]